MKTNVPTYGLYGEASEAVPDFWIHTESISERSSRYNWEIKQHRHENFFQILQIRGGTGDATIDGNVYRLSPGTLVLIPEKVSHGFRFSKDIDGQIITALTERLPINKRMDTDMRQNSFMTTPASFAGLSRNRPTKFCNEPMRLWPLRAMTTAAPHLAASTPASDP